MLDDLKYIHQRDTHDLLGQAERQWQQLGYEFVIKALDYAVDAIVCAAVGDMALAAQMTNSWPGHSLPFQVVSDYDTPAYVSDRTLFIALSYAGNDTEVLSALEQAEVQGATVIVIAAGGELATIARDRGYPLLVLPPVSGPRFGLLHAYQALLATLAGISLFEHDQALTLERAGQFVRAAAAEWQSTVPTSRNLAKQLALEVIGRSVVIGAGPDLLPAATRWKQGFNQLAKQVAWCAPYPEFRQAELSGWSKQPVDKPYTVIELCSSLDHLQVQKQFEVTERLLSGLRPSPELINVQGEDTLEQLLWSIMLGDFVTTYTALLNGLDPSSDKLVEKFNDMMEA